MALTIGIARGRLGEESAWIARAACAVTALSFAAPVSACPPSYTVETACPPTCGIFITGATSLGINEAGDIVGYADGFCYGQRAFVWLAGSASMQILPMPAGTFQSYATAINNQVDIVGSFVKNGNGGTHGFMIDNGVFADMGTLPGGNWSQAYDLNDAGVAVGFWGNSIAGPMPLGMSWFEGAMTDMTPAVGFANSWAYGISESGLITGLISSRNFQIDGRAFVWDGRRLTVLPPVPGGFTSFGRSINELGQVAGWGYIPCDPPERNCFEWRGFFWDGGRMVALEPVPSFKSVIPAALNDAGQVVGYMEGFDQNEAFLWEKGTVYVLGDLAGIAGTSWMASAGAINQSGQIAGRAGNNLTGFCAVRLTPRPQRVADLDCDGDVDGADLAILIEAWGSTDLSSDLDGNGAVGAADLGLLLGDWGD